MIPSLASSPESELLRIGSQLVVDAERCAALRTLLDGPINWENVLLAAQAQAVMPLFARNLKALAATGLPDTVARTLSLRQMVLGRQNALFVTELVRLTGRFRAAGIDLIAYKGPVLAALCYGEVNLRSFGDLDFLIRRDCLRDVCRILEEDGYRSPVQLTPTSRNLFEQVSKEYCFARGPLVVEPHWSITMPQFPFPVDYEDLWERSQLRELFGTELRIFAPEDILLMVSVGGAKGRWKRLQMICDMAAVLQALPNLDADKCLARARRLGTQRILLLGCYLARELLGAGTPEPFRQPMRSDLTLPELARRISRAVLQVPPRPPHHRPWRYSSLIAAMRERPTDKARYFWRATTTPAFVHMKRMPLPKRLFGLYRILVPLHDYLLQPVWDYVLETRARAERRTRV